MSLHHFPWPRGVFARGLALLLMLLWVPSAHAAAPYADWIFKVERAAAQGDDAALTQLSKDFPELARIWFWGNVFDLGIAAIPDKEKQRIRHWAERFAQGLAATDEEPLLILELPPEVMAKQLAAMQALLEPALGDDEPTSAVVAGLATISDERVARAALHALLHRAHVANPRLGGNQDARRLLDAARGLAEALSLIDGDLASWRTVAAFQGSEGVTAERPSLIEERIMAGFNALLVGNPQGQATLDDSVRALAGANAPALRVSLMGLGAALAADLRGDRASGRTVRQRVSAAVKVPWINAALARSVLESHVKAQDADGALAASDAFDRVAGEVMPDIHDGRVRTAAVELWRAEATRRTDQGQLESADRLLTAARSVADRLKDLALLAATVPAERRAAEGRARIGRAAEVAQVAGQLALRRGAFEAAAEAFAATRDRGIEAQDAGITGRAHIALAHAHLAAGALDQALAAASAAVQGLPTGIDRAQALAVRSEIRLWRGELAAAFSNANEGLVALKGQDAGPLRAHLHLLAASALDADGHPTAAAERLRFAAKQLDTPAGALALAVRQVADDQLAEARTALAPHVAQPEIAVADGCLAARLKIPAEAEARLAPWLAGPDVDLTVRAAGCLLRVRTEKAARELITQVEPRLALADPLESAAFLVAAALADPAAAAPRREAALRDWLLGRADGHARPLFIKKIRAFDDPGPAIQAGLDDAFKAKGRPIQGLLPSAIGWQRQRLAQEAPAPRPGVDLSAERLWAVRGALARSHALGRVAADGAVEPGARATVATQRAAALGSLATALTALRAGGDAWVARALPTLPTATDFAPAADHIRVWYLPGTAGGRIFTALPAGPRVDLLPPEAELGKLIDELLQAPTDAKKRARAATALVPFQAALAHHRLPLVVEASGTTALFPFGLLELGRPVLHRIGLGALPTAPAPSVAVCPDEAQCTDAPAARSPWASAQGRVHFAGRLAADGLAEGDTLHPRAALSRLGGRVTEVLVAERGAGISGQAAQRVAAALLLSGAQAVVVPALTGRPALDGLWSQAEGSTQRPLIRWDGTAFRIESEAVFGPPRPLAESAAERPGLVVVVP